MKLKILVLLILVFLDCKNITGQNVTTQNNDVQIAGAMKNVMVKGELYGIIDLDTIKNRHNLNGLGPVEYLVGEIIILDGNSYVSKSTSDSTMVVKETFELKAPFFVYQNIADWKKIMLSGSIKNIKNLENQISNATSGIKKPFGFKLKGQIENAVIHVVNLPKGKKISSPEQAHEGQTNYTISGGKVTIVGFFSTEHKGVFTHHSTNVHMHLLTDDKLKMGHLDAINFKTEDIELYIPAE